MANKKTNDLNKVNQEEVQTVSKSELFYNQYKRKIWIALSAIVIAGCAVLAYSKFIYGPKCEEALSASIEAEKAFQQGNFELALEGDGNVPGFAQIADEFGNKAGQAVYFHAGVCALQLKKYEEAIGYLKQYKGSDPVITARAFCCAGDAYVGLEDYSNAVAQYKKAVNAADNVFTAAYLFKEGLALEALDNKDAAIACYKEIKDKYPTSVEAYDIDRYIAALEK